MKRKVKSREKESLIYSNDLFDLYMNKYYNLFLNSIDIPELDERTKNYILRQA